ncbi:MAG: hypothetical protein L6V35_00315 [Alistipes putredinis]|nr:MAG: hypothetical protein L6V35_00315 [Alistipes putredinis]
MGGFQQSHMPNYIFSSPHNRFMLGIGGFVNMRAAYDMKGIVENTDFIPRDIPTEATYATRQALRFDASTSRLFRQGCGRHPLSRERGGIYRDRLPRLSGRFAAQAGLHIFQGHARRPRHNDILRLERRASHSRLSGTQRLQHHVQHNDSLRTRHKQALEHRCGSRDAVRKRNAALRTFFRDTSKGARLPSIRPVQLGQTESEPRKGFGRTARHVLPCRRHRPQHGAVRLGSAG